MTDEACWHAAMRGDGDAFAAVFDRHADAVYTQCLRRVGSVPEAEDLTSVTFLEMWRAGGRVRFVNGSARPWLLVVATNLARNSTRSARRYRARLETLPHDPPLADPSIEALANIDRAETVRAVSQAIASLKPAEYEVISLCDIAGLSYTEAAHALGVPIGTVRSRLSRARTRLRALLAPDDPYARIHATSFTSARDPDQTGT